MAQTLNELHMRKTLAQSLIKELESKYNDDPRAPGAIATYKSQLDEIERLILELEQQPHDVVVQLKTAILTGEVPK